MLVSLDNNHAKLTEDAVKQIKVAIDNGAVQRKLAKEFNVCPQTITLIKQGRLWGHVQ